MRIQHNISAMNSYRNFSANNSKLSKNLEKLSTGYSINRAGDDAAGLAISEKMRAQITGLEGATKNAKDGISLIQTAEGALTEVHDMLNRMTTLAEQSANGTYDNELDRQQLQKEVDSLKSEIDRIADSTNFNGLKLLDGSLSSTGKNGVHADLSKLGVDVLSTAETVAAQKGTYTTNKLLNAASVGGFSDTAESETQFTMTLNFTDSDGNAQSISKTIRLTCATASAAPSFVLEDGTDTGAQIKLAGSDTYSGNAAANTVKSEDVEKAFRAVFSQDATVKSNFTVSRDAAGGLTFEAKSGGTSGAKLDSYSMSSNVRGKDTKTNYAASVKASPVSADAETIYDFSKAKVWKNTTGEPTTASTSQTRDLDEAIFEVNGKKFVFVTSNLSESDVQKLNEKGVDEWVKLANEGGNTNGGPQNADIVEMARAIAKDTGLKVEVGSKVTAAQVSGGTNNTPDGLKLKEGAWQQDAAQANSTDGSSGGTFVRFIDSEGATEGGLQLQIGDTSDEYNTLKVSVGDMHSKMIGVGDVDISTQKGAGEALDKIKAAINNVSDTRGTLGALQNRLDHTINNLGVMRENIQNAESNIRDTDVAEEMMKYTKNNILNQSAQAMLAQANQLPQGVLQLLG